MSTFQIAFGFICAVGGGAGLAAFLRAPSQNRLDRADSTGLIVDAAVDVSELQRSTIQGLQDRLSAAEGRAEAAERRAAAAERRAAELGARVADLEEQVAELRNGHT